MPSTLNGLIEEALAARSESGRGWVAPLNLPPEVLSLHWHARDGVIVAGQEAPLPEACSAR